MCEDQEAILRTIVRSSSTFFLFFACNKDVFCLNVDIMADPSFPCAAAWKVARVRQALFSELLIAPANRGGLSKIRLVSLSSARPIYEPQLNTPTVTVRRSRHRSQSVKRDIIFVLFSLLIQLDNTWPFISFRVMPARVCSLPCLTFSPIARISSNREGYEFFRTLHWRVSKIERKKKEKNIYSLSFQRVSRGVERFCPNYTPGYTALDDTVFLENECTFT